MNDFDNYFNKLIYLFVKIQFENRPDKKFISK